MSQLKRLQILQSHAKKKELFKRENRSKYLLEMISYRMTERYYRYLTVLIIKSIKAYHNYKWHLKQEGH